MINDSLQGKSPEGKDNRQIASYDEPVRIPLAKEILLLNSRTIEPQTKAKARQILEKINLSQDQLEVIGKFVSMENALLDALGAGKEWKADPNSVKELTSRAAAVGVPLAALNLAGIGGLSAVGITSGLAWLGGMSGLTILGLNPMTAGIAALILGGVVVKKAADYVLSSNEGPSEEECAEAERQINVRRSALIALESDVQQLIRPRKREWFRPVLRYRRNGLKNAYLAASEELQKGMERGSSLLGCADPVLPPEINKFLR